MMVPKHREKPREVSQGTICRMKLMKYIMHTKSVMWSKYVTTH